MDTSQTKFLITAIALYFKTVGTASGARLSSTNLDLSQGPLSAVWELVLARDVHNRQMGCGYHVFKEFNCTYAGYFMP